MWTRNIDDVLLSLWFNGPEFPDKLMKPAKTKTQMMSNPVSKEETSSLPPPPPLPPPQASRPQGFSALAAKNTLQVGIELDDCFAGNEEDESDISDIDSDGGHSDNEMYT